MDEYRFKEKITDFNVDDSLDSIFSTVSKSPNNKKLKNSSKNSNDEINNI